MKSLEKRSGESVKKTTLKLNVVFLTEKCAKWNLCGYWTRQMRFLPFQKLHTQPDWLNISLLWKSKKPSNCDNKSDKAKNTLKKYDHPVMHGKKFFFDINFLLKWLLNDNIVLFILCTITWDNFYLNQQGGDIWYCCFIFWIHFYFYCFYVF